MKLSVIIPVYNTLDFMDRCVTSILSNQVDGGLELILVDDGSTDGCAEWCDRLALRHGERVKVAHLPLPKTTDWTWRQAPTSPSLTVTTR